VADFSPLEAVPPLTRGGCSYMAPGITSMYSSVDNKPKLWTWTLALFHAWDCTEALNSADGYLNHQCDTMLAFLIRSKCQIYYFQFEHA